MIGRENKKENDLFYTCSLIEYIARQTYNKRVDVVEALGKKKLKKYMNSLIFIIVIILLM